MAIGSGSHGQDTVRRRSPRCSAAWDSSSQALRRPSARAAFDRGVLRLPILGPIVRSAETARFARVLGSLVEGGVQKRDVFSDVTSGSRTAIERPGMKRLLDYAEDGDTVVVWRIDRLGRSLLDVLNTVTLLRGQGVKIRSVSDGIDPETTSGRMMLGMLATLAEYERELITERVNAGIAAAKQNGTRFGRPPVDPAVIAEKLEIAGDARAKGRTAEDAARLVGWSRATLYRHRQAARAREAVAEQV